MQPFKLTLSNGATLTGLHNRPRPSSSPGYAAIQDKRRPLVVAIHGGTYSSKYFDADARHTASLCSNSLGVPVVAIDRPLYQGTTSFYPLPEGSTYHEELAVWLHRYILPAVWHEFGRGCCRGLVLHCHSLAVPSAVLVAGWVAREEDEERAEGQSPAAAAAACRLYPLDGMTISGFGSQKHPDIIAAGLAAAAAASPAADDDDDPNLPLFEPALAPAAKDALVLPAGTADPAVHALTEELDNPMPRAERADYELLWFPEERWRSLCAAVRVPVLVGVAERDGLWVGSRQHAAEFAEGGFAGGGGCERLEYGVVGQAPHCMELSYVAQGWYARCFGWALECAAAAAAREEEEEEVWRA